MTTIFWGEVVAPVFGRQKQEHGGEGIVYGITVLVLFNDMSVHHQDIRHEKV
jgi:hypothetical protein